MNKKLYIVYGVLILVVGVLLWRVFDTQENTFPEILFLPVGQGDSALIKIKTITILVDAGPSQQTGSFLDGLIGSGTRIDVVIISHGDTDHINGLLRVLLSRPVGVIVYSGTSTPLLDTLFSRAREQGTSIISLRANDVIMYDDVSFSFLWPTPDALASTLSRNDASISFIMRTDDVCALFLGDISASIEKEFVMRYGSMLDCDVLKVAHHGSKTSSSDEFVRIVSPSVSIIPVGKNSYGHPAQIIIDRLQTIGSGVWRTDQDGLIRVLLKPESLLISPKK